MKKAGSRKRSSKKSRQKARLPLPRKPGHPIGTPKGRKGYDRKDEREEIEKQEDDS